MDIGTLVNAVLLLAVGALGVWLYNIMSAKPEENADDPLFLNFNPRKSHGRFIGVMRDMTTGAGGRHTVTVEPRDVDLEKLKKEKKPLLPETFIVDTHKLDTFTKGTLSKDRHVTIGYPDTIDDMSEPLKNSLIGIGLQFALLEKDFVKKRVEILQGKVKNRDDLLKEIGDAEMTEEFIQRLKAIHMEAVEFMLKAKETKKPETFSTLTASQPHA